MYIENINGPADVKKLNIKQMTVLASEMRDALLTKLSRHGGHFGPNFGMVEATIALHYVFESPKDKFVFDVSHQSYPHKMLTGRKDAFLYEEHYDDVSGYSSPHESEHDHFTIGHTSTSVSLACGLAKGRDLKGEDGNVVAIIGDGSLSGGEALEALNYAAELDGNLIILVNDNDMSIAENHGGLYQNLRLLRETGGKAECNLFRAMGLDYRFVADGNDIASLIEAFKAVKDSRQPVIVHIVTQKGKGLKPAEENPGEFHAVSSIDLNHLTDPELSPKDSFSSTFGCALADLGDDEPRLCGITAAMKYGTGLNFFKHRHPGRFFDVGMAEEHAVSFAAGLASQGLLPVVAIYSTFFQRAYDQIIHDVNLMQLDVLFAVDRAGLVPGDGATHQGIYDVAFFSNVNIPVFAPANYAELRYWLTYLVREARGPRTIRYARGEENPALAALPCTGKRFDLLEPAAGARIALVSYGAETEEIIAARDLLAQNGQQADCVKLTQIYPLPDGLCDALKPYDTILFAEDSVRTGSIGEQLGFALQQCGWQGRYLLHAVDNTHLLHANVPELRKDQQLDAAALCTDILNHLKEKQA